MGDWARAARAFISQASAGDAQKNASVSRETKKKSTRRQVYRQQRRRQRSGLAASRD
ncbi:hypothetical protein TGRUB_310090, partial [Toxoplasma gondii RUB]